MPFTRCLTEAGYPRGAGGQVAPGRERGPEAYGIEGTHLPGWGAPVDHPAYLAYLDAHGLPRWSIRDEHRGVFPNGRDALLMAAIYEGPVEGTYPYFLAERAIAALREYAAGERPFHLSLHFFGPHLPYIVPRAYAEMYDPSSVTRSPSMAETFAGKPRVQEAYSRHWAFDTYPWEEWQRITAMYWGYVTLIDEQIGASSPRWGSAGLADDTAVFFSTDHAGFVGAHRLCDKGPMMYDDIYHIPFLARLPGGARGGVRRVRHPARPGAHRWLAASRRRRRDGRAGASCPFSGGERRTGRRRCSWSSTGTLPYPQRGIRPCAQAGGEPGGRR